jgi:hypothetical protein
MDGDLAVTNDRPEGLPTRVGREKVDESLQIINDLRASRGLPPIDPALLDLDMFVSIDMRLTKDINFGGSRRLQLFLEGYNLTNHVKYQPFTINTNIISSSFLIRNSARDGRQAQWGARFRLLERVHFKEDWEGRRKARSKRWSKHSIVSIASTSSRRRISPRSSYSDQLAARVTF